MVTDEVDKVFVKSRGQVSVALESEEVVLSCSDGVYYSLNRVAKYIFDQMNGPVSVNDLVAKVCGTFDVDEENCRKSIEEFIADLMKIGLVESAGPRGGEVGR